MAVVHRVLQASETQVGVAGEVLLEELELRVAQVETASLMQMEAEGEESEETDKPERHPPLETEELG